MDKTLSGLQTLGAETPFEIQLIRQLSAERINTKEALHKADSAENRKSFGKAEEASQEMVTDEKSLQGLVTKQAHAYPLLFSGFYYLFLLPLTRTRQGKALLFMCTLSLYLEYVELRKAESS